MTTDSSNKILFKAGIAKVLAQAFGNLFGGQLQDISPIFLDLQQTSGATKSNMGTVVMCYRVASIVASPFAHILISRCNNYSLIGWFTIIAGIAVAGAAISPNFLTLTAMFVVYGITRSVIMLAAVQMCHRLGKGVYTFLFLQLIFSGNSVGYFLGTVITKPFLSKELPRNATHFQSLCGDTPLAECEDDHVGWFYSKSYLFIPFIIYGILCAASGVAYLWWARNVSDSDSLLKKKTAVYPTRSLKVLRITAAIVALLFSTVFNGLPGMHKTLLVVEFVTTNAAMLKSTAVNISMAYFAVFALSRISLMLVHSRVNSFNVCIICSIGIIIVTWTSYFFVGLRDPIYWFFSVCCPAFTTNIDPAFVTYIVSNLPGDELFMTMTFIGYSGGQFIFPEALIELQRGYRIEDFFLANAAIALMSFVLLLLTYPLVKLIEKGREETSAVMLLGDSVNLQNGENSALLDGSSGS